MNGITSARKHVHFEDVKSKDRRAQTCHLTSIRAIRAKLSSRFIEFKRKCDNDEFLFVVSQILQALICDTINAAPSKPDN